MYGYIWKSLPGPAVVRALLAAAVLAAVGVLLWYVVFPELVRWLAAGDTPPVVTR